MKTTFRDITYAAAKTPAFRNLVLGRPVELDGEVGTIEDDEKEGVGLRLVWKSGRKQTILSAFFTGLIVDVDDKVHAAGVANGSWGPAKPRAYSMPASSAENSAASPADVDGVPVGDPRWHLILPTLPKAKADALRPYVLPGYVDPQTAAEADRAAARADRAASLRRAGQAASGASLEPEAVSVPAGQEARATSLKRAGQVASGTPVKLSSAPAGQEARAAHLRRIGEAASG